MFTVHSPLSTGGCRPILGLTRLVSSCVFSCVPILTQSKQEDLVQDGQAKGWVMDQDEDAQAETGLEDTDGEEGCTGGAEGIKARFRGTGVDVRNRIGLDARVPGTEQSFRSKHTYSPEPSPGI